jgi:hypothetical protein
MIAQPWQDQTGPAGGALPARATTTQNWRTAQTAGSGAAAPMAGNLALLLLLPPPLVPVPSPATPFGGRTVPCMVRLGELVCRGLVPGAGSVDETLDLTAGGDIPNPLGPARELVELLFVSARRLSQTRLGPLQAGGGGPMRRRSLPSFGPLHLLTAEELAVLLPSPIKEGLEPLDAVLRGEVAADRSEDQLVDARPLHEGQGAQCLVLSLGQSQGDGAVAALSFYHDVMIS